MIKAPNVVLSILLASGLFFFFFFPSGKSAVKTSTHRETQPMCYTSSTEKNYTLYFPHFIIVNQLFSQV